MKFREFLRTSKLNEGADFFNNDPGVKRRIKLGKNFLGEIEEIFKKDNFTYYKIRGENKIKLTANSKKHFDYAADAVKTNAQKHKYTYRFDPSLGELNVFDTDGVIFSLIDYAGF